MKKIMVFTAGLLLAGGLISVVLKEGERKSEKIAGDESVLKRSSEQSNPEFSTSVNASFDRDVGSKKKSTGTSNQDVKNIGSRFRDELRKLTFSETLNERDLSDLFTEIRFLEGLEKMAFQSSIENKLIDISFSKDDKLEWIADNYQTISKFFEEAPTNQKGYRNFGDQFSGQLYGRLLMEGLNPLNEIKSLADGESKNNLLAGILPHAIIAENENHSAIYEGLSKDVQVYVDQNTMELSALRGVYRTEALGKYLEGRGVPGVHEELPQKWFSSSDWILENAEQLEKVLGESKSSARRDRAIGEMVKTLSNVDRDAASGWIKQIKDRSYAEKIREVSEVSF
jgi:hypothetical protein